ncbi:unnamed protein product [Closterium sp. NIES-54]
MSESQPLDHWDKRACPRPLGTLAPPFMFGPSAPRPQAPQPLRLPVSAATATATKVATAAIATTARTAATAAATTDTAALACCTAMASLRVLAFDHEGRPVQFDTWLNDLQLYLLSNSKDSVSLFDLASCAAPAPPATADTQALYDAVVARYSLPATAALGRLLLPYLFPELSTFTTVEDLVSHLRTSDARYRATVPAKFLDRNQPPMFITLYFIVTRLPDSLPSVRDHFLSLDPTSLTVDLLEEHLLAVETSAVATSLMPRTSELLLLVQSAVAARERGAGVVEGAAGVVVGAAVEVVEVVEVVAVVGVVAGVEVLVAVVEAAVEVAAVAAVGLVAVGLALGVEVLEVDSTCGKLHTQHCCFSRLDNPWPAEFGDDVELPHWADLLRSRIAIFDLDFDAILSSMYALSVIANGDCYWCVPPDPGIAAAALGASESGTLHGTAPAEALHTFTLDSSALRCFFCDSTTLTPLPAPVPVGLAEPSGGPVVARSSTVLPCPAVSFGSLSGLHLPSFSTNLVSTAACLDAMVNTTSPQGQRVSICTYTRTGHHLAMFTRRPGSSLYTLATEPSQVAASAQVNTSGQVPPPCSCRLLSHLTLLWHHHLGHPSLPRLHGMHSRLHFSHLPRSLSSLPPSPAPPCLPCVEGRQRAAPHSSSFPPTTAPLQTLHMDVWGPARVTGQGRELYFLLVVDDYTRYTTVFPLRSKGEVVDVFIPWIHTVRLQLRERFSTDLPVLRQHSDRGGEFSSNLLRDFCRGEGILQSFTLPDSSQQNGIAECRIGLVMEVARTSMTHATAPHFLWPFADVTFDESVPFYRLFPYRSAPLPPPLLFFALGSPSVDPLPPQGPAPSGVSPIDPPPGAVPGEDAETGGAVPGGVKTGSVETRGAEPGDAKTAGVEPAGDASEGVECGGAKPQVAASSGGSAASGAGGAGVAAGAGVTGGTAATGPGGARTRGTGAAGTGGVGGSCTGGAGAGGARVGGTGAGGARVGGTGTGGARVGGTRAGGARARGAGAVDPGDAVPDPESNHARAASPTISRLLATAVTDPSFEPAVASTLIAELLDFSAAYRLDNATALVTELASASPPSVGDIPTPRSYAEAITGPYSSRWQAAMDAEMASWKSTGTYVDEVPPPAANIVDGMSIFRVKRPPGSPSAFKARYVARGFSQRQGVDYFQTFSPTPKMTTLQVLQHATAQRDYELTTLAALGFPPSTTDPSLFLRIDTLLSPFYVLVYVDDLVFATANSETLTLVNSELQKGHSWAVYPGTPLLCLFCLATVIT